MKPDISVITVNYNGLELTAAMIASLRQYVSTPIETIVVDNGSLRDEAHLLAERFPVIVAIRSERNLGFAGGNNLGLRAARGRYLLLLNNDTEVGDDSLHYLCYALENHPRWGAVSPKIRFADPPRPIQFAGYTPLSKITLRNGLVGFNREDDGSYDTPHETPYAHGAAMMVRRETIEQAGEMPELYFLYYEEIDWSSGSPAAAGTSATNPAVRYSTKRAARPAGKARCGPTTSPANDCCSAGATGAVRHAC